MIKRSILVALLMISLCSVCFATPVGLLFTLVSEPVAATSVSSYEKTGDSSSFGVFGLVAFGDAGIAAASKKNNITTIHHVDKTYLYLLGGIFAMETTKVYGK